METLREHFLRQAGVVSLDQARLAGLSNRQVQHRVATGEWLRVRRGVYRLHAAPPLPETSLWAAVLWVGEGSLLAEDGATWWWGIDPVVPTTWTFAGTLARPDGHGVRLTRAYVARQDRARHRGLAVVSPAWAVLTTAARRENAEPGRGIALIDRVKQTHRVRQRDLEGAFARHPGCWGAQTMRTLLRRTGDGAHSELERAAVDVLRRGGVTGFQPNLTVRLANGGTVEIDIAFPDRRTAIELDGFAFHAGADAFRRDLRRGNALLADGWTVRRFSWDDVVGDPDGFLAAVLELLRD